MRRWTPEDWSGVAMLAVCVGVVMPVLFGVVDPQIPLALWAALFIAIFLAVLIAAGDWGVSIRVRRFAYVVAMVLTWVLVFTAHQMGLLLILLVVIAALGPGLISTPLNLVVIVLNTAVVAVVQSRLDDGWVGPALAAGFYFLIQVASVFSVAAIQNEQRMRTELSEAHVELQAASVVLGESARSAERLRIARELHDLIGHQLTVLTLELEAARHRPDAAAQDHVERADQVARSLLSDVRATVSELRELPAGGLAEALRDVGRGVPGLEVAVEVADDVTVDEEQTLVLVRAVQEIVTNTVRHAGARELWIRVDADGDRIRLSAGDDGHGVADVAPGNGLRGLTERFVQLGGEAEFSGRGGFEVAAWMPVR